MKVTVASYLAELVGTFFFLLAILGSAGQPLVVGGALALVIFLIAGVSGGHVNPAVSTAMWLNGSLTGMELVGYAIAQLAGAASAVYAYRMVKA